MSFVSNSQLDISNTQTAGTTAAQGPAVLLTPIKNQNNVVEIHSNRRQVSNFPDFSNTIMDFGKNFFNFIIVIRFKKF